MANQSQQLEPVDFKETIERALLHYDAAMAEEVTAPAALGLASYIVSMELGIALRAAVLMVKDIISRSRDS